MRPGSIPRDHPRMRFSALAASLFFVGTPLPRILSNASVMGRRLGRTWHHYGDTAIEGTLVFLSPSFPRFSLSQRERQREIVLG